MDTLLRILAVLVVLALIGFGAWELHIKPNLLAEDAPALPPAAPPEPTR
jgi:hypothetical protein